MATSLNPSIAAEHVSAAPRNTREWIFRFALVALGVGIAYLFEWRFLRYLTSELNLRLDAVFGLRLERLTYDTVRWGSVTYVYQNACIFADVWCGALPLLWNLRRTVSRNLLAIATFTLWLFAFNVARLTFSDVIYANGVPWTWAHDFVGGLAYFVVWMAIFRMRGK